MSKDNPSLLVTQGHISDTAFLRTGLMIALAIMMLMSIYIISSLSQFLLAERIPVVGTFLSIGTSKKKLYKILLFESLMYGILGAIVGTALSFLSVRFVGTLFNEYGALGIRSSASISPWYLLAGIVFALVLSTIITISAITKVEKFTIKDTILGTIHTASQTSKRPVIIGIGMLVFSAAGHVLNTSSNFLLGGFSILLLTIGFVCIIPFMVDLCSTVIARFYQVIFGNVAAIGAKNLKNNKIIGSNIRIITIVIALLMGVFTIILSAQANGENLRRGQDYELLITNLNRDLSKYKHVAEVPGVEQVYQHYVASTRFMKDSKTVVFTLQSIDKEENIRQFSPGIVYNSQLVKPIFEGKSILVDEYRAGFYNITIGDKLILSDSAALGQGVEYTVVGFLDSKGYTGDRSIALISETNFIDDIKGRPAELLLKTSGDIDKLRHTLQESLTDTESSVITQEDALMASYTLLGKTLLLLEIVLVLGIFMGLLGMANNLYVGFLQRKRELAVLYSVGLDIKKLKKMLLFEQMAVFGTASILGIILGMLIVQMLPNLLGAVGLAIDFKIPFAFMAMVIIGVFAILMLSMLFPIQKISNMDIVEELKYE